MIWWTLVSFRLYRNWKIYKERKGKEKNRYVDDRYVEEQGRFFFIEEFKLTNVEG